MKVFTKLAALAAIAIGIAVCGGAHAGTPTTVLDKAGVKFPTEPALAIEKDTTSGNRVKVKYSSGYQYAVDDAAWTVYASFKAGLTRPIDAPASTTGAVYDVAKSFVYCISSKTYVSWPNVAQSDILNDGCSMYNATQ